MKKSRDAIGRTNDEHIAIVERKASARMGEIDALPAEVRELVHDYGYMVVRNFLNCGVTKHKHIRHLVETVLNEFSPTRSHSRSQGQKHQVTESQP